MVAMEDEDLVERALTAIALRLDGKAAAATVIRRKRAVFYNVLDAAATGKNRILTRNPLVTMRWAPPQAAEKVDRGVLVNPGQARELLAALTRVGGRDGRRRLVAMFGRLPVAYGCTPAITGNALICGVPAGQSTFWPVSGGCGIRTHEDASTP